MTLEIEAGVDPTRHDDLLALADAVLARVSDGDAEVVVTDLDSALTRFADNAIHQNVAESGVRVRLRVQNGERTGVATVRGNVTARLQMLVDSAVEARAVAPAGLVTPLPGPGPELPALEGFSAATAAADPEQRAEAVAVIAAAAAARGVRAYGAFHTSTQRTVVVNSRGLRRAASSTGAGVVAVARGDRGSGYVERAATDVGDIDAAEVSAELVETCLRNQNAEAVAPGDYEVVLAPYAVQTMAQHLSNTGFSALALQEGRSFMRIGERLMSPSVTIYDDPGEPGLMPMPFDSEGVAARRVVFIDSGVCREVMHDSATAQRAGVESTGHALPMPNMEGPFSRHLAMAAGDASVEELIGAVQDGLFVTRFWYVRDVHPLRTVITGMTRDGLFRIKDGKLAGAVKDLRFTQSIVDALADVRGIGRKRLLGTGEFETAVLTPALHLGAFTFSS